MFQYNLPSAKGSYLLVYFLGEFAEAKVGSLGKLKFQPGYFLYCGSAKGPGGLNARINHHLKNSSNPHWHIDYFKKHADLVAVGYTTELDRFECQWSDLFNNNNKFEIVQRGFGASDCNCRSHFYFCKNPFDFIANQLDILNIIVPKENAGNCP